MQKPKNLGTAKWGMVTRHQKPFGDGVNETTAKQFDKAHTELIDRHIRKTFKGYWGGGETDFSNFSGNNWRNYYVFWSAKLAATFATTSQTHLSNFVEVGVSFGMSFYYAISGLKTGLRIDSNWAGYLYDSWGKILPTHLSEREMHHVGNYWFNSLAQTQVNLEEYKEHCHFVEGYVPEIFSEHPGPSEISWLHIDLGTSVPTLRTLEHFIPKLLSHGVVLFDDYGHNHNREIKVLVDNFLNEVEGILLYLPTGQAIFIKN
jgi:hypothetical protein